MTDLEKAQNDLEAFLEAGGEKARAYQRALEADAVEYGGMMNAIAINAQRLTCELGNAMVGIVTEANTVARIHNEIAANTVIQQARASSRRA